MAPGMAADRPPARPTGSARPGRNSLPRWHCRSSPAQYSNRVRRPFVRPRGGDRMAEDRPDAKGDRAQELVAQVDTGAAASGWCAWQAAVWRPTGVVPVPAVVCVSTAVPVRLRRIQQSPRRVRSIRRSRSFWHPAFPAFRRSPRIMRSGTGVCRARCASARPASIFAASCPVFRLANDV